MLLEGKRVVVIGGSSGIGLAIGRQARAEGASLVITGRDPGKLSHAASGTSAAILRASWATPMIAPSLKVSSQPSPDSIILSR